MNRCRIGAIPAARQPLIGVDEEETRRIRGLVTAVQLTKMAIRLQSLVGQFMV